MLCGLSRGKRQAAPFSLRKGTAAYIFCVRPPGARRFAGGSARDNEALARRENPSADEAGGACRSGSPAEQTEKDAEAAFPKTSPGRRTATPAGGLGVRAVRGVAARRRVRPSARPSGRLRGRGRTKPAAQVQRRGRSMSQKVFSCKELSKDRFVHQSIIGADASCLQRVRLSAKSEQGLILPSPFQSCTSDRPPKCQVYADRTCTWQYLPLSCGAKPPFPSRHGTGPAVCV